MRCRECDYPLWNLHARVCPECGAAFTVREQVFTPSAVQFHCPGCDQVYYGTDASGHLEPPEFDCVTCGRHLRMDDMVLRPRTGLEEHRTRPDRMPWLERRSGRRIRAWLSTIGLALVQPASLMRAVPVESPLGEAWRFAIITTIATVIARLAPVLCVFLPLVAFQGQGGGISPSLMVGLLGGGTLGMILVSLVLIVVSLALWTLVCHAALRVTGDTAAGLGRTAQAILYSSGANTASAVPCLNDVGWIWWVVSAVLMVRTGQKVSGWRASFAVLAYPVVMILCVVGFFVAIVSTAVVAAAPKPPGAVQQAETTLLAQRLAAFVQANAGSGPGHALELVPAGTGVGSFVSAAWGTTPAGVDVAGTTLAEFGTLGPGRQRAAAAGAAAELPPGVVAYRVGDFVFTDPGVDRTAVTAGLWVVVMCPDPDANPSISPPVTYAARVDGTLDRLPAAEFLRRLERQNTLRGRAGLAALPDPRTITHAGPAVGR